MKRILFFLLILSLIIIPASASNRTMETDPIPTLNETRYDQFLDLLDGGTDSEPDWGEIVPTTVGVYTDIGGQIAVILIMAIPFVMQWIMQQRSTIPAITGIILSGFLFKVMPPQYGLVTSAFIALYVTNLIYTLYRSR
jgi:hypothetical protein